VQNLHLERAAEGAEVDAPVADVAVWPGFWVRASRPEVVAVEGNQLIEEDSLLVGER
jgi:hypothetical protein